MPVSGVTIDLNGHTLSGTPDLQDIQVLNAGNVRVTGPGRISGFRVGVNRTRTEHVQVQAVTSDDMDAGFFASDTPAATVHDNDFSDLQPLPGTLATFTQLQRKALSYNNLADADAAWECVRQFDTPACVIVKHANPCGVTVAVTIGDAYEAAFATDPTSPFGGIIAFNQILDEATAKAILDRQFVEA